MTRALVVRAAGTNCDRETAWALELAGAKPERVHVGQLKEHPERLLDYQLLALPGGFTYGDDLGAGRLLATELVGLWSSSGLLRRFVEDGRLVIGICNGFQALVKAGWLPDTTGAGTIEATLTANDSSRFECRWIHLRVTTDRCPFLEAGETLEMPVAHGEGKLIFADAAAAGRARARGQLALEYVTGGGAPAGYPLNPAGSPDGVAGVTDPSGRILGLMPHPERNIAFHHHPHWTRRPDPEAAPPDGLRLFQRGIAWLKRG